MSKQVIVFIDGQNLYHLARVAWASLPTADYRFSYPSYDVKRLASINKWPTFTYVYGREWISRKYGQVKFIY